jgi:hypothetical protein
VKPPTQAELLAFAQRDDSDVGDDKCRELTNDFLADFFARHPLGSVSPDSIRFPEKLLEQLVRWAQFLVQGRTPVHYENDSSWKPVARNARRSVEGRQVFQGAGTWARAAG